MAEVTKETAKDDDADGQTSSAKKTDKKIPSSYPSAFSAQPHESYKEWKRAVQCWIAGEGGLLPASVIGPRVLSVLKGRASILTRKLSISEVSNDDGLDRIFRTLEASTLVQELSGQREFLQCRRAAHESLDSYLMRVEAQRNLMIEEDPEFAMGERFLVGYVLDNSELTQKDRVLVMAAANNQLTTSAVYPALRRMGPFLQGTVPIGRGLSDRPLLPELVPDSGNGSTASANGQTAGAKPRWHGSRSYGAHVAGELEELADDGEIVPEDASDEPDEIQAVEHEALVAVQQGQAKLRAIRQARGYYKRNEQNASGDSAAKERLRELMAKNPCRGCGGFGHWSRDPECPRNKAKAAASANVMSQEKASTMAKGGGKSLSSSSDVASGNNANSNSTVPHAAMSAVLESLLDNQARGVYMTSGGSDSCTDISIDALLSNQKGNPYDGMMIVDIGCIRSVAGMQWIDREVTARRNLGRHVHVERVADWFRFGDGVRRLSRYRVYLEVAIKGHVGLLPVNAIDFPCPPLLSKAVCNVLGMCIDCGSNTCEIRKLGERKCLLHVSSEGHYLLPISDFNPRNPNWKTLTEDQRLKPKIDSDDVRMFEVRSGVAVGKGSRIRKCTSALISHGLASSPSGGSADPLRARCLRDQFDGDAGGGRVAVGGGCQHDIDAPKASQAEGSSIDNCDSAKAKEPVQPGSSLHSRGGARPEGQEQEGEHQVQTEAAAVGCDHGAAGRLSVAGHDKVLRPGVQCLLDRAPADDLPQVEGPGVDVEGASGYGSLQDAVAPQPTLAGQPLCAGAGSTVGTCGSVRPISPRQHRPSSVPSCVRAFQRGQVQRIKKGISQALHSLALLKNVSDARAERRFCVMEVFGTSLSLHASESSDWTAVDLLTNVDLSKPEEQRRVLDQIDSLEPDLLVITPPCGPWSCMQAINDQDVVVWKRLMDYHYWTFTRKVWDRQVAAGRLCITEQPWLSKALELKVMVQRPCLHRAIVDQCQFNLVDAVSRLPMRKRTVLDCNRASLAHALEDGARCSHHPSEHQPIEGAVRVGDHWVRRSLLAGMWTKEFCLHILSAASRALQSTSEVAHTPSLLVASNDPDVSHNMFHPSNVCSKCGVPSQKACVCAYCGDYLCHVSCATSHRCVKLPSWKPSHEEPNTGFLSCVADVDPPSEHVVGDEDQQTEIAIRKEFQRLQQEEDMRKGDFSGVGSRYGYIRFVGPALRLPKEVRNQLSKLHGTFAHPSNERLARMLQINGASKAIIEGAKCIRCSVCERVSAPRSAPQTSAKAPTRFNQQCSSDSFFIYDCTGSRWNITHIVDGFCSLQYAIVSKNPCSNTSSELVFERWILVHGPMETLYVDGGPEFKGQLEALCRLYAIHLEVLPVGSKWKAGLAERHGAVLKLMILRMIHELSLCTDKELRFAVAMACQAKNRLLRKCGRSPIQVTQGQDQVIPSSLLQQVIDGDMKYSTNAAITTDEEINRMEQIRCAAISAFHWLDSHERLRVALNSRSKPPKLVALTPGTQVYFHKPPGQHRRLQDNATGQQGPAVVAATEGVDKVWLRYKGTVVRVALENIRLATPEESLDTQYLTDVLTEMQQELTGERRTTGYEELTDPPQDAPMMGNVPSHELQQPPTDATVPSLSIPAEEMTPEVQRQLIVSKKIADRLDGHMIKRTQQPAQPSQPSMQAEQPAVGGLDGIEDALVKDKVEFFNRGADPAVWQSIVDRVNDSLPDANDSTLIRARRLHDLHHLDDLTRAGQAQIKRDRCLDATLFDVALHDNRELKVPRTAEGDDVTEHRALMCEAGVVPWAPGWAAATWALTAEAARHCGEEEARRIMRERQEREDRLMSLEKGLDDDTKAQELEQCALERGHKKGPNPGARGEIYVKDMTPAEIRMTVPALVKALSIHFEHDAIRPIPKGQIVPKERGSYTAAWSS